MRIILNIDTAKDTRGKKAVRLRCGYYLSSADDIRVSNCGVEIYNYIQEAFEKGFEGGIVIFEGEKK